MATELNDPKNINGKDINKESLLREYIEAIEFYLKKRRELHDALVRNGCGILTMEPDYIANEQSKELERPSIIYVCHKKGNKSHVRVMVRENKKEMQERIEKEAQKKTDNSIRSCLNNKDPKNCLEKHLKIENNDTTENNDTI